MRDDRGVGPREAQRAQRTDGRPFVRRQHGLRNAQVRERAHFGEALQRGFAWIGDEVRIAFGGQVAVREPRVVMRRTGDAVEIDSDIWSPHACGYALRRPGAEFAPGRRSSIVRRERDGAHGVTFADA